MDQNRPNPLASFMRQPKIYIKLPSNGEYWTPGSINISSTGEYPVYSMTARDELMLKVPDALMNGQAVVDVIQNCIPNIKDAWSTPNIDIDLILIAIRLATYGEMMVTPLKLTEDLEFDYQIDLRTVMDTLLNQISWDPIVPINDDITVYVKPLTYQNVSSVALQTFETQKIMDIVNNKDISDEEKVKIFGESFKKLTESTVASIGDSISKIDSSQGSTDDPAHINEFIANIDKSVFKQIQTHLEQLQAQNSLKPIQITVTDDLRAKGFTGDTIEIPLTFNPSTFFV